jgi:dihydrofolate synthase/folylpolyglutamate synthase
MTLGLANIRALMSSLGNPQKEFGSVVVAGTNGKGSVSAYLSAILKANGRRVGWYSSPHVYAVNERIHVDGSPVPVESMEAAAARIVPFHKKIGYSYFEALTAIAFQIFAEEAVEIAVLETGLGGRFDATNVVDPVLTVLTGISLDHRRILGDSEEEILREKLGITRPGVPLVCGRLSAQLHSSVEAKASREEFELRSFGDIGSIDLTDMSFDGMRARISTRARDYGDVLTPFIGTHQLGNTLLAVGAAEILLDRVERLEESAELVPLPGRFEVLRIDEKTLVFDVAHNDESLVAGVKTLAALSPREENCIILGIMRRKEFKDFSTELPKCVGRAHLIESVEGESHSPGQLLGKIGLENIERSGLNVALEHIGADPGAWTRFIRQILSPSTPCGTILITGSHRTVERFGRHLHRLGLY